MTRTLRGKLVRRENKSTLVAWLAIFSRVRRQSVHFFPLSCSVPNASPRFELSGLSGFYKWWRRAERTARTTPHGDGSYFLFSWLPSEPCLLYYSAPSFSVRRLRKLPSRPDAAWLSPAAGMLAALGLRGIEFSALHFWRGSASILSHWRQASVFSVTYALCLLHPIWG